LFAALTYYKSATSLYSLSTIKDLSLVVFLSIGFDIAWLIIYEQVIIDFNRKFSLGGLVLEID
jgi:hypothetical protein